MSFLSGLVGGLGGFLTGGPVGAVTGAITGSRGFTNPQQPTTFPQSLGDRLNPFTGFGSPGGFFGNPFTGKPLIGGKGKRRVDPINGRCPQGYHPAKDGKGCVRNRHMNFGNGRATSRAIRRIHGAEKQFSHIFHMTHRKTGVQIRKRRR